ncbi:DM13 domain-containing protein [Panacibacter sp. DH6]|uniref:DM13 domain-containing protein n=1 Tax=Panacibacter microcysteis TaxID=2793269 RepID=A0A931E8C7_9BACT|nr:DM13 domain-containing protein [Panacibacter microcysteis]MBG9377029.1 DM13 domain-containing protein [Panacibacter microcysteis]
MKVGKITIVLLLVFMITSCAKQNATPSDVLNEQIDTTAGMLVYSGMFSNGPYGSVSGDAGLYLDNGKYILYFDDIKSSNGPDLHVYLSEEEIPVHFIDLGKLKSTNGNQSYVVPVGTDFAKFRYALIHCQQYNHLFGSALLEMP